MKKFICMILLLTLSSSSVMAQFADQLNKKIVVTNEVPIDVSEAQIIFLNHYLASNYLASDSLKSQIYIAWRPWDVKTILLQIGTGALGFGLFTLPFLVQRVNFSGLDEMFIGIMFAYLFGTLGLTVGVYVGGNLLDGNGDLLSTFGGLLSGLLLSIIYSAAHQKYAEVAIPVLVLSGPIIFYHLSASPVITTNQTGFIQFDKNKYGINLPTMKINRYEYPTTSYGISANVLCINF